MICATRDENVQTKAMETSVLCVDVNENNIVQSRIWKIGKKIFLVLVLNSRETTDFDTLLYFDGKRSTAFTLHMNEDIYTGRRQSLSPEDGVYISALPIIEPKEKRFLINFRNQLISNI